MMADLVALILFVGSLPWLVRIVAQGLSNRLVKTDLRWIVITLLANIALYFSAMYLRGYAAVAAVPVLFMVGPSLFNGITMKSNDQMPISRRTTGLALLLMGLFSWYLAYSLVREL